MFRVKNSPILRSTFLTECTAFDTMRRHCCRSVHCTKNCIYIQNVLLRMGEFVARNMLGWFKKMNKRRSSCNLLVVYIVEHFRTLKVTSFSSSPLTRPSARTLVSFRINFQASLPLVIFLQQLATPFFRSFSTSSNPLFLGSQTDCFLSEMLILKYFFHTSFFWNSYHMTYPT